MRDRLRALRPPAVPTAQPSPPAPPQRRALPAVLAVAAVLLLLAVVGVGWAVNRDDDEPRDTSASQPPASATPSEEPTADEAPADGDVETAVANMAAAFAQQPAVTPEVAECLARAVVDDVGLARLQEIGMLDEQQEFTDVDLAAYPDVKAALSSATFACVTA